MQKDVWYMVVLWDRFDGRKNSLMDRQFEKVESALSYIDTVKKYSIGLKIELREYVANDGYKTLMQI